MVQGKKNDTPNGSSKYYQSNMSFQRKDGFGGANKGEGRQNGNAFRTDTAISGGRNQGERILQRWVPEGPAELDGSLESSRNKSAGAWDQFAENKRLFGLTTDYDESIYTTVIDRSHPQYKKRLADADRKAREIERSVATNSHVAEERLVDNIGGPGNGADEEDKYSGVPRQQAFPPLPASSTKYTPPARRTPVAQSGGNGTPVDPAIISSQLARSDKLATEKTKSPTAAGASTKSVKPEVSTLSTKTNASSSATLDSKNLSTTASSSQNVSHQVKSEVVPNATATVERDVASAFKNFAVQQRKTVEQSRNARLRNDKEIKLNDLKNFANNFKLHTPVPSDLVPIIAKDPKKQKEIQEKAQRNAEEASRAGPPDPAKASASSSDARSTRPTPSTHGSSPSNIPGRQTNVRNPVLVQQGAFRGTSQQPLNSQQNRQPGNLGSRLRGLDQKSTQIPTNPVPVHENRHSHSIPANSAESNYSRRSSGVTSIQGARLNPNSSEFRPSPHAPTFNPSGNPSTGSSPRSVATAAAPAPIARSVLRHKPVPAMERPSLQGKFNSLEFIKSLTPPVGKEVVWKATGGLKPAYDTQPVWKQAAPDEKTDSPIRLTYNQLFDSAPFPSQTMSPPNSSPAFPQVAHQHQLPIHLQQGAHNMSARQSPRQPHMGLQGNPHGPAPAFSGGHEDHRMIASHSSQSFTSPRLQNVPMAYPSPMNQPSQLAFNPQMMQYSGPAPQMQQGFRSLSQSHQFLPQQSMAPIMVPSPAGTFLSSQSMAPGPQMMFQGGQGPFIQASNGHPQQIPGVNGYPSPGRSTPMMVSQGPQQGHQQPVYGINPGISPGPQFGGPMYAQQPPLQMQPMRGGYAAPNSQQFGTSPQIHQYGPQQHRNNHPNGNYNKNFQHGQHHNSPSSNQIPTGPQSRRPEVSDEAK